MTAKRVGREMIAAGVIGISGDMAMQVVENRRREENTNSSFLLDKPRSLRLCTFRVIQAPIISTAWGVFDRIVPWKGPAGVVAKVALDQTLLMPPSMCTFFVSMGLMEGMSLEHSVARATASFPATAMACVPYWSCVHSVTFGIVPARYRIVWVSCAAVGWNMFISQQNADARRRERV